MHSVVPGTEAHARAIVPLMAAEDRSELAALAGDPVACMVRCVQASCICRCALVDDAPAFLGGGVADGHVWMISTPAVAKARRFYLRVTRAVADEMQEMLPFMWTHVDERYTRSLRWLEWLGFEIGEPMALMGRTMRPVYRYVD